MLLPHRQEYRADIDGLRAFAVLSVVGFHAFPRLFPGGFVGVDIFFVISGFLISRQILDELQNGRFSFLDFYLRRARRLFPALLAVLALCLVLGWFLFLPAPYKQLGHNIAAASAFLQNLLFASQQGYFDIPANENPLLHLWSLGIEEQFYLFWPLVLWLLPLKNMRAIIIIALICLLSFALNVSQTHSNPTLAFYNPGTRLWELGAGGMLAWLGQFGWLGKIARVPRKANALSTLGMALLVCSMWIVDRHSRFPGYWAILPVLGTLLVIAATQNAWANATLLSDRTLVRIGLISYPLYLWHWPVLAFMRHMSGQELERIERVAAVVVSLVLAGLTYRYIEKPAQRQSYRGTQPCILIAMMLAVGITGYSVHAANGVDSRYPSIARELANYRYDIVAEYRYRTCFLERDQHFSDFQKCQDENTSFSEKLVLWGDSHAAHLYQGYKAVYGNKTASWKGPWVAVPQRWASTSASTPCAEKPTTASWTGSGGKSQGPSYWRQSGVSTTGMPSERGSQVLSRN